MEYFRDMHGITITDGVIIKFSVLVKTGERQGRSGRNKTYFSVTQKKEVVGVVRFGLFKTVLSGELITYYVEVSDNEEYLTHAYSGIGWSKSQRAQNETVKIVSNLSRPLTKEIADACEIIGVETA